MSKDGGNVTFTNLIAMTGKGAQGGKDGTFFFRLGGSLDKEVMRIEPDGSFYVHGRKVTDDRLVYLAFKGWLMGCDNLPSAETLDRINGGDHKG